jgi:hypothetical protein
MLTEPVGPELPAGFLREHPATTLLADVAAWPEELPR